MVSKALSHQHASPCWALAFALGSTVACPHLHSPFPHESTPCSPLQTAAAAAAAAPMQRHRTEDNTGRQQSHSPTDPQPSHKRPIAAITMVPLQQRSLAMVLAGSPGCEGGVCVVVQATDASMMKRRCRATEAMGLMATAVGKQAIAPLVPDIMQAALKVPCCPSAFPSPALHDSHLSH